jgi:hypothetical protein
VIPKPGSLLARTLTKLKVATKRIPSVLKGVAKGCSAMSSAQQAMGKGDLSGAVGHTQQAATHVAKGFKAPAKSPKTEGNSEVHLNAPAGHDELLDSAAKTGPSAVKVAEDGTWKMFKGGEEVTPTPEVSKAVNDYLKYLDNRNPGNPTRSLTITPNSITSSRATAAPIETGTRKTPPPKAFRPAPAEPIKQAPPDNQSLGKVAKPANKEAARTESKEPSKSANKQDAESASNVDVRPSKSAFSGKLADLSKLSKLAGRPKPVTAPKLS